MYRILVVDDEPVLLEQTRIYLEQSGDMQVDTTTSSLQVLDVLSKVPYDAVIADYEMPEMDGITLLKEVRNKDILVPFIIFSGRGREEIIIEALNNGADFYLQKGGNPSAQFAELQNMIFQAVRRKRAEEEVQRAGALYQSVFEHTGSATIIIESDMTISLMNSEAARLTGYTREEIEGKMPWTAFVVRDDLERLARYHRERREASDPAPRTYEFRIIDRNGTQKDMHMTIGLIPGTKRSVASMVDVSDRKRYEEELSAAHEQMTAAFEEAKASQESLALQCRELEDYQANLRGIINFLPDPTFVLDREEKITIWNRAIEEMTGIAKSRIMGLGPEAICKTMPGLKHPLVAETVLASGVGEGESVARNICITSPHTGEEIYLWAKASPLYDAQGRIFGAIESLRDITRSRRMEAQIQHRMKFEQIVRSISTQFIGLEPADLESALEETLQALGSFLGVDRSYILRFSPDLTGVERAHEWCAEGVEPQIEVLQNLPPDMISWGMEQIGARKSICISDVTGLPLDTAAERDFFLRYGVVSIILVPIATAGEILGALGFETTRGVQAWSDEDITLLEIVGNLFADLFSRIRVQEQLRKSEERFRTLVERSHDCFIRMSRCPPTIEYISPSWERLTGYTHKEFTNDPDLLGRAIHPDDRETFRALAQEPGADRLYAFRGLRKDGRYIWVEVCPIPVYADDGRLIAVEYAIHDIDAWKQAEAALIKANKKLTLMNSIVRHDILNQVTVVLGHIALLQEHPLDPIVAAALDKLWVAIKIIQSQIEFTRDYQDLGVQMPGWFRVKPLIIAAAKALRPSGITIEADLDGISIYADPLLSSAFYNLLENTMRHGKTVTSIRATAVPDSGGARIVWEDDGVGVPDEHKERIFERGFGSHTGLGLFLVKEILSITGITIQETGVFGEGVRFEMVIPEGNVRFE